jgi:hypothetical protein
MTDLIPQLSLVTTTVGGLTIRLGVTRGLLQLRRANTALPILRPTDRRPRLRNLHPLPVDLPAEQGDAIKALVYHGPSKTTWEPVGDDDALSRRELACASCGYGISVVALPWACPMCQGVEWRPLTRPRGRRSSARFGDRGRPL